MNIRYFGAVFVAMVIMLAVATGCVTGVSKTEMAEVYFKLGKAYFDLGQFDNAVNAYAQSLEYDESLVKAGYNLAHVYLETGRIAEAREILEELLLEESDNAIILSTLGWAFYLESEYEEALNVYRRVNDRLAGDPDATYNIATLLWRLERYDEALEAFLELYELEPSIKYVASIAELYERLDDPERAISYLELFLAERGEVTGERLRLARLYAVTRDYGKSVSMYNEAIALMEVPEAAALFERGKILLLYIEDFELGLASVRAALQAGFSDGRAAVTLAESLAVAVEPDYRRLITEFGLLASPDSEIDGPETE